MANRLLLNDGTSFVLRNGGADKLLLATTGFLDRNNGVDQVVLNDGTSQIILHPDPYIGPVVPTPATFGTATQFLTDADHLESAAPVAGSLYTVTGWVRLKRPFPSSACRTMWSLEDAGGTTFILFQTNPSSDQFRSEDSTNFGIYTTVAVDLSGDGWYFIGETHNGATPATVVYWALDGQPYLQSLAGAAHGAITPAKMLIGSSDDFNSREYLEGAVNRVRVWNAELSAAEILAEMLSATVVRTSGLWASYPLAPGASMLLDDSGNGRNLTNPSGAGSWQSIQGPLIGDTTLVAGTVAAALGSVVSTASGGHGVAGTSAQTLAAVVSAAAGAHGVSGTSAQTLAAVVSSATAAHGVAGSSATTIDPVVSAASGTFTPATITGTCAATLDAVTCSAAGAHGVVATSAAVLAAVTAVASGTFTEGVTGSVAVTLGQVVAVAIGTVSVPAGYYVALARAQRLAAAAAEQRAKEIRYRLMSIRRYPWFR